MKLLTLNFLCCARKTCKTNPAAFPLHPKEAELEQVEAEINPLLIQNMLPRLNWEALKTISQEVKKTKTNQHFARQLHDREVFFFTASRS
jgi:multifunctional methyltransferase subunit TRM112